MKLWSPKTRILLPAIGGLALLGLGSVAVAKPDGADARAERSHGGLCERLECSDQQKQELQAVMTELRADTKADREAIERLQAKLAAELAKAKPDEKAMQATLAAIETHEHELRARAFDAMMEVHALLAPEQRAQMAQAVERHGFRGLLRGAKGKRGKAEGKKAKAKQGGEGKGAAKKG